MLQLSGGWRRLALCLIGMLGWASQAMGQALGTTTYREREGAPLSHHAGSSDPVGGGAGPLGLLPATFAGNLPCADCPGIRQQLELFPDQAFFLRMTYLGKGDDASIDDLGSWMVTGDQRTLVLFGGREAPRRFP